MPSLHASVRVVVLCVAVMAVSAPIPSAAQSNEGIVIRSFDATYALSPDGSFTVLEDIVVDFRSQLRHGILRDIPVEYDYDAESKRLIRITGIRVDNGTNAVRFQTERDGRLLRLRIGDPDRTVAGQQRYRISYRVEGGLNAFEDHDELFWNVTGNDWLFPIERASATVPMPARDLQTITCYQGPTGSTAPCTASLAPDGANFQATIALPIGSGLTIVVAIDKGVVSVPPPILAPLPGSLGDYMGINSDLVLALTAIAGLVTVALLVRSWWRTGRDRWLGDNYYLADEPREERIKPLFARETIVPEFGPPEIAARNGRRAAGSAGRRPLRPAEIGLLLDEKADTLDVSATIIDLAVRGYLRIEEVEPEDGDDPDYRLTKLKPSEGLLPYELLLMDSIFDPDSSINEQHEDPQHPLTVRLSKLKGVFASDLSRVKDALYSSAVRQTKLFPKNPESVIGRTQIAAVLAFFGAFVLSIALAVVANAGLIALPFAPGALVLLLMARFMPRRSGIGREMYRRSLGFRLFMTTAQADYQKFLEEEGVFDKYLPHAIVFHCVKRWADRFAALGITTASASWFASPRALTPLDFAYSVRDFSGSVSGVMAASPVLTAGSSDSGWSGGFSGFSGGGSSGGGGGGGGGGSW